MKIKNIKILRNLSLALLSLVFSACETDKANNALDQKLVKGESYFIHRYTEEFATRFTLPRENSVNLSRGLNSIAIEIAKKNNYYQCSVHLYLDSHLDLAFPEEGSYFSQKPIAEYFFADYNEQDLEYNVSKINLNNWNVLLRQNSLDQSVQGNIYTMSYERVHQSFLPGLTIVTIDTSCMYLHNKNHPADLWLKNTKDESYELGNYDAAKPDITKSHRFNIPIDMIMEIQADLEIAIRHNLK